MDSNFSQVSGTGLPQPPGGQGAVTGQHAPGGQGTVPQATLPVQVADEPASDDELDKEWVNRAKDIVEQTKSDPFTQSSQLNKVKAEYLRARFGKDFKVGDKPSQ